MRSTSDDTEQARRLASIRRIKPLRGQCLVEILPENDLSPGGISIPETAKAKDDVGRLPALTARVIRLGPWEQKPNGFAILPEIAPGHRVIVNQYAGKKVRVLGDRFRLLRVDEVLAKLA